MKKEAKTKEDENEEETHAIKGKKKSKAKKKEKDNMLDESEIIIEEGKTEHMKKGKKGKSRKASGEVCEVEEMEPKKKKRKKDDSKGEEETLLMDCEESEADRLSGETPVAVAGDTTSRKSKKKKSSVQVNQTEADVGVETDATKKKKKKKKVKEEGEEQQESPNVDVVSEKSGNTDEIDTNQERRQTDEASGHENPAKPLGLGQWSTAEFSSSQQQQKFLRLMGGFKKGFQPAAAGTGGAHMAMGKDAQQQLQQGLLGEFERAHSRRMDFSSKGAGLGFAAPSNKKFSIDINTCRSVRFDN